MRENPATFQAFVARVPAAFAELEAELAAAQENN
jgi:hypothetical protein